VFLTQSHCKQTQGSDLHAGISIDQIFAKKHGQDTTDSVDAAVHRERRPVRRLLVRLFVRLHRLDQLGVAEQPLPMIRDPRACSISCSASARRPADRKERRSEDRSILDWLGTSIGRMKKDLGTADRARLNDYLDDVREIERESRRSRRTTAAASSASCRARRSACRTRSPSTSS
jgi:hypothetical protein